MAYLGMYYSDESIVYLSNYVRMASKDYTHTGTPRSTTELLDKWKCARNYNYTLVDRLWGPDSICKCLAACSAADGCSNLEKDCLDNGAPIYAHVFAGVSNSYYNVVIALLFIHISVLLNMTIPLLTSKINDDNDDDIGIYEVVAETSVVTSSKAEQLPVSKALTTISNAKARMHLNSHFEYIIKAPQDHPEWDNLTKAEQEKRLAQSEKAKAQHQASINPDVTNVPQANTQKAQPGQEVEAKDTYCWAAWVSKHVTKNMWIRLALYIVLSTLCITFSSFASDNTKSKALTGQECKTFGCVTQTFLGSLEMIISVANFLLSLFMIAFKISAKSTKAINDESGMKSRRVLYQDFTVTIMNAMEDITMAGALMLLVSTFSAQGGTRDDTTLFFDVVLIAFISLMLRLQHDVMSMRETLIEHVNSDDSEIKGDSYKDNLENEHKVNTHIMSYFLNTRLFIFAVVAGSSFVFIERLDETTGILDKHSTWNESMRLLVLFVCILPNLCSDISYEVVHGIKMQTSGVHTAYVGPQFWRRTIYLGYVLVLIASSWGRSTSVVLAIKATATSE